MREAKPSKINPNYRKHFSEFSQNVAYAARTWHSYVYLQNHAAQDEALYAVLDEAADFWNDYTYAAPQTTILFLGKIFDSDSDAFSIDKLIKSARDESDYFSKERLRQRKVETAGEFEGLDEYIAEATELDGDGLKSIKTEVKKARAIWEKIKPLRDKVYAHSEILSDDERKGLYAPVKNDDIDAIIQILLNVSNILWQAEWNGSKPDFSYNHKEPIERAKRGIDKLIRSLTNAG